MSVGWSLPSVSILPRALYPRPSWYSSTLLARERCVQLSCTYAPANLALLLFGLVATPYSTVHLHTLSYLQNYVLHISSRPANCTSCRLKRSCGVAGGGLRRGLAGTHVQLGTPVPADTRILLLIEDVTL
ncbi:uncharacterized protein LAJ45_04326 [Morchella importuna]|uniref:uncharacterized protein n=1 Tax=Morchella importuna TaxID=1174673 RepID=UPI001E8D88F4|nr:uncharacterized protein LAJ45_04326 [Morchella importuna]KAH8151704.1 hypothetical protein LAJ45_04326 [Morchella importuna]